MASDEKRSRGFAAMDPEKHRAICRKGGAACQKAGLGHRFTRQEAIEAGKKGAAARIAKREKISE
jgi:general stress protein YciG